MSANRQGTPRRAPVATLPAHGAACPGEDNHSRFHGSLIPGYDASSKRALLTSKNTLSFALNLSNEPRPLHKETEFRLLTSHDAVIRALRKHMQFLSY